MFDKRIVFMGTPKFAATILNDLIDHGFNIVGVVTQKDKKIGRKQVLTACETKKLALEYARAIKLARGKCKSNVTEEQFKKYIGENDVQYKPSLDDKAELPFEEKEPPKKKKLFRHR